jgi:CheY-like chemotaxis protein
VNKNNILIADDDSDDFLIFSLATIETKATMSLTRAEDGEELMQRLDENIPDILFLDIHMPRKDGRECLKEIRADRRYDALPVIIYSSFTDSSTLEYCFREGSNLYIIKPDSLLDLAAILRDIFIRNWSTAIFYPPRAEFLINPLS